MYIILILLPTFLSYFSLPDPEILSSIVLLNCPINVRDFCDLHVLSLIQEESHLRVLHISSAMADLILANFSISVSPHFLLGIRYRVL